MRQLVKMSPVYRLVEYNGENHTWTNTTLSLYNYKRSRGQLALASALQQYALEMKWADEFNAKSMYLRTHVGVQVYV